MTLGVGVLCERGECVVMASEQRASYGSTARPLSPNDECSKQFYLRPIKCFVNVAGSLSVCHAVYSEIAHKIDSLSETEAKEMYPEDNR